MLGIGIKVWEGMCGLLSGERKVVRRDTDHIHIQHAEWSRKIWALIRYGQNASMSLEVPGSNPLLSAQATHEPFPALNQHPEGIFTITKKYPP